MQTAMLNGILPVFKEEGYTSNDVVALLRGILKMKKIGHTGTLDPAATGVLPVCLGRGTKLVEMLTDTDKEYRTVMRLGVDTDTEDMTGTVLKTGSLDGIDENRVTDVLMSFVGDYDQIPPMYSAKKINGKKLYEYARAGIEIERKSARVHIYEISIEDISLPLVTFSVKCSKGTYIRSLCRDCGLKLGCFAAMESLVRTKACGIGIDQALKLDEIKELCCNNEIAGKVISVEDVFKDELEYHSDKALTDKYITNGNSLTLDIPDGRYRVYLSDGRFASVYDFKSTKGNLCKYFLT